MEKRKLPRLTLSREQFKHSSGKLYGVADLSQEGMGLRILDPEDLYQFTVGTQVQGLLNIRREKFPVIGSVRHLGRDLVGVEFSDLGDEVRRKLQRMLDPAVIGRELQPIPTGDIHLWYTGPSGSEFLLTREFDGRISKMRLLVLGSWIQWDEELGVMTGTAELSFEKSEVEGVTRFDTLLVQEDLRPDRAKIQVARTLLSHSILPQDLKSVCVRYLSQGEA